MKKYSIIMLAFLGLTISSCETQLFFDCLRGDGDFVTGAVEFAEFEKIIIQVDAKVEIIESEIQEVVISGPEDIVDKIIDDSRVNNKTLKLDLDGCMRLNNDDDLKITISVPTLSSITIQGDADVFTQNQFNGINSMDLEINGDGFFDLALNELEDLDVHIQGDGEIFFSGIAQNAIYEIEGDGKIYAEDMIVDELNIDIEGDGYIESNVNGFLAVDIAGDGEIKAEGSVSELDIKINGDGKIEAFGVEAVTCNIKIQGDGECEVNVSDLLIVEIIGDGDVCYKGDPDVELYGMANSNRVKDCN